MVDVPLCNADFYSDTFIQDPWPRYAEMRALGPVIYLPKLDNYALTRHKSIQAALRDPVTFCSSKGVAGDRFGCSFLQGNTVASDEPRHSELRRAMAPPLLPGALKAIRGEVQRHSDALIDRLCAAAGFDVMADLARYLPLTIVRDMVGLPDFGQENMLKWAAAAFDVLGEQNERGKCALAAIEEMREFIGTGATPDKLKQGSWTRRIHELVDQGGLSAGLAQFAIRDYINPSLDTTISATGELIWQLARNPDQWEEIKNDPDLCTNAVNEAVRLCTPIRSFSRHTTRDVEVEGYCIPEGSRVMMLFASANRDEAQFDDPDRFDVTRNPKDHLGFGSGIHMCVGMHLAQMEMVSLLHAMIPRVGRVDVGEPIIAMNNTIRAFSHLEASFEPEGRFFPVPVIPPAQKDTNSLLAAKVAARKEVARDIITLTLEPKPGDRFPPAEAGAHVDVHIRPGLVRQYSLTGNLDEGPYCIAVQKEPRSRGGSVAMHEKFHPGSDILIGRPRNNFRLHESEAPVVLFAGGVGLTPLFAMAWQLHKAGRLFALHISVRERARLPFAADLAAAPFVERVHLHVDAEPDSPPVDVAEAIPSLGAKAHLYICGPAGFMRFVEGEARAAGHPANLIHLEHFSAEIDSDGEAFEVIAAKSRTTIKVHAQETILDALKNVGIYVETSCENGVCGSCLTAVLEGTPDHRDLVQTDTEKASNRKITVCCSRSKSRRLVLDV
ncbi:cytochrome P450 [Pelagibius sp. Alg239-R121]|uniref:cytochrome P450/oxidoreductase n=1 Tax=Pelagibius sp. Alg239-R121 TaxID=2993448 RepID=UPI0024A762FE|nr:cytochrome P450 [Pelagibius sp. Alg239-R121]